MKTNKSLSNTAVFLLLREKYKRNRMLECFPSIMKPVCLFLSFWYMSKKKNNKNNKKKRKIKQMKMKNKRKKKKK